MNLSKKDADGSFYLSAAGSGPTQCNGFLLFTCVYFGAGTSLNNVSTINTGENAFKKVLKRRNIVGGGGGQNKER